MVPGFRDVVLEARPSGTPQAHWTAEDYMTVARKRVAGARQRWQAIDDANGADPALRWLEIGCGSGLDCVLAALHGAPDVVGVDRDSPLLAGGERRVRALRLVGAAAELAGASDTPEVLLESLPVDVRAMDACRLDFPDASIDVVWSRTALEHVQPLDQGLRESARVLRSGGIAHHLIDPFYWLKGCHARGLTELPWAHARLGPADYERFVTAAEGGRRAGRRAAWLSTLNALTVDGWRAAIEATGLFDVLAWEENHSPLARAQLLRHPEVVDTRLPGVSVRDLTCSAIRTLLRRRTRG